MSEFETVKIDPQLIQMAGLTQQEVAADLQGPLAAQADVLAQVNSHGPMFVEFKEAMLHAVLPERHADITAQISDNDSAGKIIEHEAANFAQREQENARRQGSVGL